MAVSLVSTGVQFPDATIQTTAVSPAGVVLISNTTATNSATVDLTFTGSYTNYQLIMSQVRSVTGTAAVPQLAISTNSFSSLQTWGGGGGWGNLAGSSNGWVSWDTTGGYSFTFTNADYNRDPGVVANLIFPNAKAALYKSCTGTLGARLGYQGYDRQMVGANFSAWTTSTTAAITGVRIYMTSGNIKGVFSLYGYN
jgi:hypothetical protein